MDDEHRIHFLNFYWVIVTVLLYVIYKYWVCVCSRSSWLIVYPSMLVFQSSVVTWYWFIFVWTGQVNYINVICFVSGTSRLLSDKVYVSMFPLHEVRTLIIVTYYFFFFLSTVTEDIKSLKFFKVCLSSITTI